MGFSFRKSVKIGPIRLNASKSGIGISGGVKGARISVSPKGKVSTSIGANGVYYRSQIGGGKRTKKAQYEQIEEMEIAPRSQIVVQELQAEKFAEDEQTEKINSPLAEESDAQFWLKIVLLCLFLGVIGLAISIVLIVERAKRRKEKNVEITENSDYAETVKNQIIQNAVLSDSEVNALLDEYCQMIGAAAGAEIK